MANILGIQTVDDIWIINSDANPSIGDGIDAPIGSIVLASDGTGLFYKGSTSSTDWQLSTSPNNSNTLFVRKTPTVEQFSSIKDAVDSITDNAFTNQWLIDVGVGIFIEDTITMKPYVQIKGAGKLITIIQVDNTSKNVIVGIRTSSISHCKIEGATDVGYAGIYFTNPTTIAGQNSAFFVEDCQFGNNSILVNIEQSTSITRIILNNILVGVNAVYNKGFVVTSLVSSPVSTVIISNSNISSSTSTESAFISDGDGSQISLNSTLISNIIKTTQIGTKAINGGTLNVFSAEFLNFDEGILLESGSSGTKINAAGIIMISNNNDLVINDIYATGNILGTVNRSNSIIYVDSLVSINNLDSKTVRVSKSGGDFNNIYDAIASITSSNYINRYIIHVDAGTYIEQYLDLSTKPYISIVGSAIQDTVIVPDSSTHDVINIGIYNELSFLSINNVGYGYSAITAIDTGDFSLVHKLSFNNCDTNIYIKSITQDTNFYGEYIDFNGTYSYGLKVEATNGFVAFANVENYYNIPNPGIYITATYISGSGSNVHVLASGQISDGLGTAFYVQDGGILEITSTNIDGFDKGIHVGNIGSPSDVVAAGIVSRNNTTYDIQIEHPNATGSIEGVFDADKIITDSPSFLLLVQDTSSGSLTVTKSLKILFDNGTITDVSTLIIEGDTMGVEKGGQLSDGGGFTVSITDGYGYFEQFPDNDVIQRVDWINASIVLSASVDRFIYFNNNAVLTSDSSEPDTRYNILLGRVVTNATGIEYIDDSSSDAEHTVNLISNSLKNAIGPVFADGGIVSENNTPFSLDVSTAVYYFGENVFRPSGGTGITFTSIYGQGSGVITGLTAIDNTQYDVSGTLTTLSASYYAKHSLYLIGDDGAEKYYFVYAQDQYLTLLAAQQANIPSPPTYFRGSMALIAGIVVQEGTANIAQIIDQRPVIGFRASGVNASADHSSLLNLNNGDSGHLQFLMLNGSKIMSGNLNMGANNILNTGTYNGITIENHASRHLPNGADALTTSSPTSNLGVSSTNSIGIQNSFARSDHGHAIDIATSSTTGLLRSTDWTIFNNKLSNTLTSSYIFIGNNSNVATGITLSGDASISNTGSLTLNTVTVNKGGTGLTSFGGTNTILYTSTTNALSSITTSNTSTLITSNTGAPSWVSGTTPNRILRTDGTTISFSQIALTSDVSGILPINNGGTNATSSNAALNNLLPSQTGNTGSFLQTDGSNSVWTEINLGTVTSFSSGDLSTLFITSIANSTTTPLLSFTLSNANANSWFGNNTEISNTPIYNNSGSLTKIDDDNLILSLGGSPSISLLNSVSLTLGWTSSLSVIRGGTGLTSFGGTNRLLFTSTTNTLSSITTSNTSALVTNSSGVPFLTSGITANRLLRTDGTTISFSQVILSTDVTGILPINNGGTGQITASASFAALSPLTTKADILTHDGVSNLKLSVGSNSQVLTTDSTQAAGVKWANITLSDYIFAYDTTSQTVGTANGFQDVTFNTNAIIYGWSHIVNTPTFICNSTGTYMIEIDAFINATGGAALSVEFRIMKNGVEIPGSQIYQEVNNNSIVNMSTSTIFATFSTTDTLKVQMTSTKTSGQIASGSGISTTKPSIKLTMIRVVA